MMAGGRRPASKELASVVDYQDFARAFFILSALAFALALARTINLWF